MAKNTVGKVAVALAVSSIVATSAHANPKVYGRIDLGVGNTDVESTSADNWNVESFASRLGVKGSEEVADGLSIIYRYELEIDPEEESVNDSNDTDFLKAREQYVGLKGDFGTVRLGRMDTPVKTSQGKVDLFGDHLGDIKNLGDENNNNNFKGENRPGDTVNYTSPKLADAFQVQVALLHGEGTDDLDGDGNADDGIGDAFSSSVVYEADGLYGAFGYEADVDGQDLWRLTGRYSMDALALGILVQGAEGNTAGSNEEMGYLLSAAYSMNDLVFKFQYAGNDIETASGVTVSEDTSLSVGVDRHLSNSAKVYAEFTLNEVDATNNANDEEITYFGAGIQKKF